MIRLRRYLSKRALFLALDLMPQGPVRNSLRKAVDEHALRCAIIARCTEEQGE